MTTQAEEVMEHLIELTRGPKYTEAKRIAEKMLTHTHETEAGLVINNGQRIMIGAMVSAMLMGDVPEGEVEQTALDLHQHFLRQLLKHMREANNDD